jgi:hypothetical protein
MFRAGDFDAKGQDVDEQGQGERHGQSIHAFPPGGRTDKKFAAADRGDRSFGCRPASPYPLRAGSARLLHRLAVPIRTTFSHADRLATIVADGILFSADISQAVQLIDDHGARAYAKLVDIRRVTLCVAPAGDETVAGLAAWRAAAGRSGAIAVVVGHNRVLEGIAQGFADEGSERQPIRIFRDEPSAHAWLETAARR